MGSHVRDHLLALLVFASATALWLLPLVTHFDTHIPGNAGDNITFVWNVWWMRYVLTHDGLSFLHTSFLLHPFGANLTLNTHTAVPTLLAAIAGPASLIAAENCIVVAHVLLNFVCAYALGYRTTRRPTAALVAGLVFGWSPFVSARLGGHFNLLAAWVVPLSCLAAFAARGRGGLLPGVALGGALALTAYVDYYLFIFVVVLVLLAIVPSCFTVATSPRTRSPWRRRVAVTLVTVAALEILFIVGVRTLNVSVIQLAAWRVTVRGWSNPITFAWLTLIAAAFIAWFPRVAVRPGRADERPSGKTMTAVALTFIPLMAPLAVSAAALWRAGDYATQHYRPRSGPGGIDAVTLLLGNPFSAFWGERVLAWYSELRINSIESCGWIPLSPLILACVAAFAWRRNRVIRYWIAAAGFFTVWSLGPWLVAAGHRTPLILPEFVIRYVPIVSNARMPGRGMVVVYLALAVLAAIAFDRLLSQGGRKRTLAWCLLIASVIELAPSAPALFSPSVSPVYGVLKAAAGTGAVCELPLGLRDGFGEVGTFDPAVLFNQTVHERPIVGGFVARLPPGIAEAYRKLPVVGTLLRLSEGEAIAFEERVDPGTSARQLAAQGIRFLVLNRDLASPELSTFVDTSIALRVIARDDHRTVYEVDSVARPSPERWQLPTP